MTKKQKLQKILSLIQKFLKKRLNKEWITPDDKRFTKLVTKYEPKLSSLWDKTRDSYLKKFKEKDFTDFENDPEQYDNPSYDSSKYIDSALDILALAFGAGVLVGYDEIISRGLTVTIPDNPFDLLSEAKEIKNYEWAALSYEQKQMNDIFDEYNKSKDGKAQIEKWFNNNKYRLTELILGGLIWYAIQYGFTRALIEAQKGSPGSNILAFWITEKDKRVCKDCQLLEDDNPYTENKPLPTLPGGGKTICGSKCRCIIDYKED